MTRTILGVPRRMLFLWLSIVAVVITASYGATRALAFIPNGVTGGGGDYLHSIVSGGVFRWAPHRLPLHVFIDDGQGVSAYRPQFRQIARDSLNAWMEAAGGKLAWTEASDPQQADIVITWSDQISIRNGNLEAGRTTAAMQMNPRTGQKFMAAAEVKILTRIGPKIFNDTEIRKTTLHEVGHALGLQGHSAEPGDIMYAALSRQQVPYLQSRDSSTIQRLYGDYPQAGVASVGGGWRTAIGNRPARQPYPAEEDSYRNRPNPYAAGGVRVLRVPRWQVDALRAALAEQMARRNAQPSPRGYMYYGYP